MPGRFESIPVFLFEKRKKSWNLRKIHLTLHNTLVIIIVLRIKTARGGSQQTCTFLSHSSFHKNVRKYLAYSFKRGIKQKGQWEQQTAGLLLSFL